MATQSAGFKAFTRDFASDQTKINKRMGRTVEKMVDPATLTMIFGFIMEFAKMCINRNGEQATIQRLKDNGGLNAGQCYRALMRGGYEADERPKQQRQLCREMAAELTTGTGKITAEDLEAFLNDVRETPTPVPVEDSDGGGFWSIGWVVLALCLFSSGTAQAEGFWDAEGDVKAIKAGVTTLGDRVASLELSQRRTQIMVEKLANHLLPESQECVPGPPEEPVAIVAKKLQSELIKPAPARSVSSGITFNGRSIVLSEFLQRPSSNATIARGADINAHLRFHGFGGNFTGLSTSTKLKMHAIAHAGGEPAKATRTVTYQAAAQGNCAYGNCSRPSYSYSGMTPVYGPLGLKIRGWK